MGTTWVRPATEFNLILETPSGDRYWMSTSFDDTNEGFEFCHDEPGTYRVILVPTVEDFGCPYPPETSKKGERHVIVEQRFQVREDACPPLEHFATGL